MKIECTKIESRDNDMDRKAMDMPKVYAYTLVALTDSGEFVEPITIRIHRAPRGSVARANVWISGAGIYTRGCGHAGGYGYCKASSAVAYAFRHAGVSLEREPWRMFDGSECRIADIAGSGMETVVEAMEAIARFLGFTRFHVVRE